MIEQERNNGEDILQELFGAPGSLSLTKGLFDNDYLDNGLCRHDRSLPILRSCVSSGNTCLTCSHTLEELPVSDSSDILSRPDPAINVQSVLPSLSTTPSCDPIAMDIRRFSQEMPMYLLEEDEGNDEEIRQIMRDSQSRTDKQQHKLPSDDNNQECQSSLCEGRTSPSSDCCRNESSISFSPSVSTLNSPSHSPSLTPLAATRDDDVNTPTSVTSDTTSAHNPTIEETNSVDSSPLKSHPTTLPIQSPSPASSSVTHPSINSLLSSPSSSSLSSSSPSPTASDCSSICDVKLNAATNGSSNGAGAMVMFPLVNWTRMTAIPINILPPDNKETTQHHKVPPKSMPVRRRKHGGGWPKGKKRRPEHLLKPPKPPVTSYGAFQREECDKMRSQNGLLHMPDTSKQIGHVWTTLSTAEKEVYQVKATQDRQRYTNELVEYIICTNTGLASQKDHIRSVIEQSFHGVDSDELFSCQLCDMEFSCVKTKLAHFCGKPHSQELLKKLQNDFVSQQAAFGKRRKTNSIEMTQMNSLQQHQVNGINKPMDKTRVVPEPPSESSSSQVLSAQGSQISPSCNTALNCNHATPIDQIPNGDREGTFESAQYDSNQSFTCSQLPPRSPHETVLQPKEWEMVCTSMDECISQTRGLFTELSDQRNRQSQLLSQCCCVAEQISEVEFNIALQCEELRKMEEKKQELNSSLKSIQDFFDKF